MFEQQLTARLQECRAAQLYRTRHAWHDVHAPEIIRAGQRYLSFCSNDYLGLSQHPHVIRAFSETAQCYGIGSGAAAVAGGHSFLHQALEEELAAFTQRPRALLFSTGYMANVGVLTALLSDRDTIFADRLVHASLMDASRFTNAQLRRYLHADVNSLQKLLSNTPRKNNSLIITDGIFSVDGDAAPLTALADLAKKYHAGLMVDDAHGVGVIGEQGRGSVAHANLTVEQVPILTVALGKAFGTFGAFVAGSETLIETIIQFARSYIYTTALPPAVVAATRASLQLLQTEQWRRDHLYHLIKRFRAGIRQLGLSLLTSTTPIQPLIVGSANAVLICGEQLAQQGILVGVMRPPTVPPNSARLRITLSALHSEDHIDRLLAALETVFITNKKNNA